MASSMHHQPTSKNHQQMMTRSDNRRMFSSSDDGAMTKQIVATHNPDGRHFDCRPILIVVENILHHVSPGIDGVINGIHGESDQAALDELEDKIPLSAYEGILEGLASVIHKISCELSCKCSGGTDAHASTMAILNVVSAFPWDAKLVISLAAFAVNYGEFWLIAQLFAKDPLAKSVATLRQLPDIIYHSQVLKPRLDGISSLVKAMLDITKSIVEFRELPSQYVSDETAPMSAAVAHIPTAVYWTVRSMVACTAQMTSLQGMAYDLVSSTSETWELSSLAHKLSSIHGHLKAQLDNCYQHIDEKKQVEYFDMLVHLFETTQLDNMRILKALICFKDDPTPLEVGTSKMRVNIDVLRRQTVLLLISDLDLLQEELLTLTSLYEESKVRQDLQYNIVWLPIVDKSSSLQEDEYEEKFKNLQTMMPWYTLHHPSLLQPAVIRFIKEKWHFSKKMILVALDLQGKVACPNALYMLWIWGNAAYPFTIMKEEELWKKETWRLQLLVDNIDLTISRWIMEGRFICLYGGEDIDWIRGFTATAHNVAKAAGITLEMVYVGGKSSNRERLTRINSIITNEKLSYCWTDRTSIWFFWTRLESMLYSKTQQGKTIENDRIIQEVLTMLSYGGSDQGWALISRGTAEMARANGEIILTGLRDFSNWEEDSRERGFVVALDDYLKQLHTPHHCNRIILPGNAGAGLPHLIVCAECGRPMENFFMYRCCTD